MSDLDDNIQIVSLSAKDSAGLKFISDCYVRGLEEENQSSPLSSWRQLTADASQKIFCYFQQVLSSEHLKQVVYVAKMGDQFIGYIYVFVRKCEGEIPNEIGVINGLYISELFRNRGVAQFLLNKALTWFKSYGIAYTELTVNIGNDAAKSFWKKNGFNVCEYLLSKRI